MNCYIFFLLEKQIFANEEEIDEFVNTFVEKPEDLTLLCCKSCDVYYSTKKYFKEHLMMFHMNDIKR